MLRSNSRSTLCGSACAEPYSSTCTEWSMTRSTGTSGFIFCGLPPPHFIGAPLARAAHPHSTHPPRRADCGGGNHTWHAGEILENDPRTFERQLVGRGLGSAPAGEALHVGFG